MIYNRFCRDIENAKFQNIPDVNFYNSEPKKGKHLEQDLFSR